MKKIHWFLLAVCLVSCIAAKWLLWGTYFLGFEKHPVAVTVLVCVGVTSIIYLLYKQHKNKTCKR